MSSTMTVRVAVAVLGGSPSSMAKILIWWAGEVSRSSCLWMETVPSSAMANWKKKHWKFSWNHIFVLTQWDRKFRNVQTKKLVKSNKSISWKNFLNIFHEKYSVLNFFPVQKLIFGHFWNCEKNYFGQKKFPWNWFIWFHEFFWPGLF